jgi:hypothetical protein
MMWHATHVVPGEIAAKICNKIKAGERFAAYINMPLFPEGDPVRTDKISDTMILSLKLLLRKP